MVDKDLLSPTAPLGGVEDSRGSSMLQGDADGVDQGTGPGLQLAGLWADVSKALSIYPESNERVLASLAEFLIALQTFLAAGASEPGHDVERGVTILFKGNEILVGDARTPAAAGSTHDWLRERMAHAGLAGVEFMADLAGPAFVAFTKQLLTNFLRKDVGLSFEALWPDTFDGLVLIDRRFEGTFGGGGSSEGLYAGGHRGTAVRSADTSHFVGGLLAHPKVAKRVEHLREHVDALGLEEHESTVRASDLITRILDDVPAESLQSRDTLISAVCLVMDGLAESAGNPTRADLSGLPSDGSDRPGSEQFAALLHQVSRTHFARKGPGLERMHPDAAEEVVQSPAGGRARDDKIEDDLESLAAELQALPSTLRYHFARGEAECAAEELAVLLHYVVHLERPEQLPGLLPLVSKLLEHPDNDRLAVLRTYLEAGQDEKAERRRAAVVKILLRAGRATLLRDCHVLDPTFVLDDPIARLPLLLAALDPGNASHLVELNTVCNALGTAVLEDEATLRPALATLPREKVVAALRRPHPVRLPLVRILLASHPERLVTEAATFLRAVDLPEDEAFLLFQLQDTDVLSRAYLCGLMDLHFDRAGAEPVRRIIVDVLSDHIRSTQALQPEHRERLASIKSLGRYPSPAGLAMLKELGKTRFGPFGGVEPKAVRRLAGSVAKTVHDGLDKNPTWALDPRQGQTTDTGRPPSDDNQSEAA